MTTKKETTKGEKYTARDVARRDAAEYDEPDRNLSATKPAADGARRAGSGAGGDVDNPVADEHTHGTSDPDEGKLGSDETNHLARGKTTWK